MTDYDRIAESMIRQLYERVNFVNSGFSPNFNPGDQILIKTTWNNWLVGDPTDKGFELFLRMFRNRPETQSVFDFAKGNSVSQMQNSSKLLFHVTRVVQNISTVVENIDSLEDVVPMLKELGGRHGKSGYDIPPGYFPHLGDALIQLMRENASANNKSFSQQAERVIRQLYSFITDNMKAGQMQY